MSEAQQVSGETLPSRRPPSVQKWRKNRRYGNQRNPTDLATIGRASVWLLPWERKSYPGVGRGMSQLLGGPWCASAIWRWCTGARRCRPEVALALAIEIERRVAEGSAIARALRDEVDAWRPFDRSGLGFLAIDPETGRNKRFRG